MWAADQQTLIHLYRSLIRSKLDYGCVVYGSARGSYLRMLDAIQNLGLCLCLSAYRTSPSSSLSVLANEPPLYVCRKRLSMQYSPKLSSTAQNQAYNGVFASKFKFAFDHKPNQIPTLGIRVQPDLHAIGFKQKDTVQSFISATPLWLLDHPRVNFDLHYLHKEDIPPEIYRSRFHELSSQYDGFNQLYTDGSKIGDQVASAAVVRNFTKTVRLPDKASIFRVELYTITLAMDFIRHSKHTISSHFYHILTIVRH